MAQEDRLKILLLAHDLSDAAIHRRVAMLRLAGATVVVAGFRRTKEPIASVAGCKAINFGQTYNYRFIHRILLVLRTVILLKRHRKLFCASDAILARNLEMLAIGVRGRSFKKNQPSTLIYECLDIHRLLLNRGMIGTLLRTLEGWLSKRASALFTSSPAFVQNYFSAFSQVRLPVHLIENKVLSPETGLAPRPAPRPAGPPWIIGWFGIIRCRKSLKLLTDLVNNSNGKVEVIIRGRPDYGQFDNFDKEVSETPGLRFLGPYKNPRDLAAIYDAVHFSWAIDMFEEGFNSAWLLPNRLYEGGAYGAVPLALNSVETGDFLSRHAIGATLAEPLEKSLPAFFARMDPTQYRQLESALTALPRATWVYDKKDCVELVNYLRSLKGPVSAR